MAPQRKPSFTSSLVTLSPIQRSPAWVRILFWCILGAVSAIFVATLISCPILLLLQLLYPDASPFTSPQSQATSTSSSTQTPSINLSPTTSGGLTDNLTSTPSPITGSPLDGTLISPTSSLSDGTASPSSATASLSDGTISPSPATASLSNGTASPSAATASVSNGTASPSTPASLSDGTASPLSTASPGAGTSPANSATSEGSFTDTTPSSPALATDSFGPTPTAATSTLQSSTPTPTATPTVPTPTPTPRGPTPPPRRTPAPYTVVPLNNLSSPPTLAPLPTNTPIRPTSTSTATTTPTGVAVRPVSTRIVAPAAAPDLPGGILTLIEPISVEIPPTRGPTTFIWEWLGDPLPPEYGFEVRVWLTGEPQAGVHDAVLDHREGRIEAVDANRYQLKVGDIRYAKGVLGREGIYNWTVAVVRVSPAYADFGLQAVPARFLYEPFSTGR